MDENTAYTIVMFLILGWIPILAFGKALSWVILACKGDDTEENEEI